MFNLERRDLVDKARECLPGVALVVAGDHAVELSQLAGRIRTALEDFLT